METKDPVPKFRYKFNLKQTSYCYYGKITSKGEPIFTERELKQGFQVVWVSLDDAISIIKSDDPMGYEGSFIQERDLAFLRTAKQILGRVGWL
ncbi:hypothetical protein KKD03_03505 [Patescibacteria group bacterium]|nr:hypothetical protein [Patescibacteria group bacterium]